MRQCITVHITRVSNCMLATRTLQCNALQQCIVKMQCSAAVYCNTALQCMTLHCSVWHCIVQIKRFYNCLLDPHNTQCISYCGVLEIALQCVALFTVHCYVCLKLCVYSPKSHCTALILYRTPFCTKAKDYYIALHCTALHYTITVTNWKSEWKLFIS